MVITLRYVVLHHTGVTSPHFDLLFEWEAGEALTSFHCPTWPPAVGDRWEERPDHRRAYLDYEGEVSGGRGHVARVAVGTLAHAVLASDPPTLAIAFDPVAGEGLALTLANVPDGRAGSLTEWVVQTLET